MKQLSLTGLLLLAACAGGASGWSKPGADDSAAAAAYRTCREAVDDAVRTQADIDSDIAATRGIDAQRSQIGRMQSEGQREQTRDRAGRLMAKCMQGQGFSPAK